MRIAYIAPYQGPGLLKRRPTLLNLSLAGNVKIELIADLLHGCTHDVEILSQGEVVERRFDFYGAFSEPNPVHADIPVHYASALPIKFVNGLWSSLRLLALFKRRHRRSPYDLVIVYNLKFPQVVCASYAIRRFGLPVVLENEDDSFVDIGGKKESGFLTGCYSRLAGNILNTVSGCIGASPHLLSRVPSSIPKLLLRGIVGHDFVSANQQANSPKKNWVVYSGTHFRSKGLEQLITAWKSVDLPGWELHFAGRGELTNALEKMAIGCSGIVFHGLISRHEMVRLMTSAKVCINPHDVSRTPGNVFAFKIIEYLAAGAHVITTPMGVLEKEIEKGITYMPDNSPTTIAATLQEVVQRRKWEQGAAQQVIKTYGSDAVSRSLRHLIDQVLKSPSPNGLRTTLLKDAANCPTH